MDYRDEVFLSVAENLSFTKAAEELFISQPAVTKHIKELENKLQTTLFERKGNRVYLTRAGKTAYQHLKEIKKRYREMEFQLGQLNNTLTGTLRLGASSTISQYVIPTVIAAFYKRYPDINIYLYNGNSFEMEQKLLNDEIDMALVENASSHSNLKYVEFLPDEIVAVAGTNSPAARKKQIAINDLKEIPLVVREKGSGTLEVINRELTKHKLSPDSMNIVMHLGSTESIKNFLTEFDGVALVSEKSINKELELKKLKRITIKGFSINRYFRMAFRHGHTAHLLEIFSDFLLNYNF